MKTETEAIDTKIADASVAASVTTPGDDTATATASPGDTTVYTPEKQMLDFERANARRAREEAQAAQEALEETAEELESLKTELSQLKTSHEADKTRLQTQREKLEDMDPGLVDPKVIANIQRLERALKEQETSFQQEKSALQARLKELDDKAKGYEQERLLTAEEQRRARAAESVITTVERSLGRHGITEPARFRAEARKMADDLVDSGEVKQPQDFAAAVDLIEDCYLKVKAKHDKTKAKTVSVDTGKSGVGATPKKTGIKPGRLDAVYDQMAQDDSWRQE